MQIQKDFENTELYVFLMADASGLSAIQGIH